MDGFEEEANERVFYQDGVDEFIHEVGDTENDLGDSMEELIGKERNNNEKRPTPIGPKLPSHATSSDAMCFGVVADSGLLSAPRPISLRAQQPTRQLSETVRLDSGFGPLSAPQSTSKHRRSPK
ncbi:hypothetical protein Q3G72_007601 [Acer saccharum]|nr:hypothetical protein Q3G72_007601 [Acer saccharum]